MAGTIDTIHVLHVDDEPDFTDLAATFLEREEDRFDVETATSASEGFDRLETSTYDCVVSDHDMPGKNGIEFLEEVREEYPDLPFILYTGKGSEEVASDAISAGVTEYLQKEGGTSQYTVLANRIRNAVEKYDAQTELANREKRLNLFFEKAPLGVIEWDENFNFVRLNDTAERILGYSEEKLVGRSSDVIVPESEQESIDEVVSGLLGDSGGYRSINENIRENGERIVCEWHNRVVTDGSGDVVAIFSQFQDITEGEERKAELQRSERRYEAVFNDPNILVGLLDTEGTVLDINQTAMDYIDPELDEITGEPFWETPWFDHAEDTQQKVREWTDRAANGEYVEFEADLFRPDGEPYTIEGVFRPVTNDDGEVVSLLVSDRDITEQKKREQQLEALNHIAQKLMSADTRDEVVEIGVETARDLLGMDMNAIHLYDGDTDALVPAVATDALFDLVGKPPSFTGDNSIAWRVYQRGETLAVDDIHEDPDRYNSDTPVRSELYLPLGEYGILLAGSPSPETFDEQDVLLGEILASGLVTALEQIERTEQLRARERELTKQNDRLEEFASIVSHDLRNPLTVADGRLELAAAECDSEHLEYVERAHDRMQTLIEDLLTVAREGEAVTDAEPVVLASLVEGSWATVETGNSTLITDIERTVLADRSRLKQLFENLFRNAVEHGSTGPDEPASQDSIEHGDENVTVIVGKLADGFYLEDDGPGIPAAERETLFEAGYSTSEDGTGFGLTIVKQIVDAHGWNIHVTNGGEGGARFEITGVEVAAE